MRTLDETRDNAEQKILVDPDDESVEAGIIRDWKCYNITVETLREQLRERFHIPNTFKMEVQRQGVVVPIPDLGIQEKLMEIGVWFCFEDHVGSPTVEVALMRRQPSQEYWTKGNGLHQYLDPEKIPEVLDAMLQQVNWGLIASMGRVRLWKPVEEIQKGRSSTLISDAYEISGTLARDGDGSSPKEEVPVEDALCLAGIASAWKDSPATGLLTPRRDTVSPMISVV